MKSSLFKVRKNRSYNYQPQYFDKEKEETNRKKRLILSQKGRSGGNLEPGFLRQKFSKEKRNSDRSQRVVLFVALILSLLVGYFFMPEILSYFGG